MQFVGEWPEKITVPRRVRATPETSLAVSVVTPPGEVDDRIEANSL
jgi:hypothetical protein